MLLLVLLSMMLFLLNYHFNSLFVCLFVSVRDVQAKIKDYIPLWLKGLRLGLGLGRLGKAKQVCWWQLASAAAAAAAVVSMACTDNGDLMSARHQRRELIHNKFGCPD